MEDCPKEFEEDMLILERRRKPLEPAPEIMEAMQVRGLLECMAALVVAIACMVAIFAIVP